MTPTRACPRCGRANLAAHSFCPACGENLSPSGVSRGWKLLIGSFLLFAVVLWAAVFSNRTLEPSAPRQHLLGGDTAPTPTTQTAELTSAQHLAAAKKALADGHRPDSNAKNASAGEVEAAKWHLKQIAPAAPEYREAQELLREVALRERQTKPPTKEKVPRATAQSTENDKVGGEGGVTSPAASPATSPGGQTGSVGQSRRADSGLSSDDYYTNVEGRRVRRPTFSESGPPSGATAQCRDGSYSFSRNRRGTCSHHGGVARWL